MDDWTAARQALSSSACDDTNEINESRSLYVRHAIALQSDCEAIDDSYYAERKELERKYELMRQAYYRRRLSLVHGISDVYPKVTASSIESNGIPRFWLLAIGNHPVLEQLLVSGDIPILESLINVNVVYGKDYASFNLYFTFAENEYFNNKVLFKEYHLVDFLSLQNPILEDVKFSPIEWKDGKNVCKSKAATANSKKKKGKKKVAAQQVDKECKSFFRFFSKPLSNDDDDDPERIDMTEDEDYTIAQIFRTDIIPNAILWFTGEDRSMNY